MQTQQPKTQTLSVPVAAVRVIDELKKVKRGLTVEDIEKRTGIVVNGGLFEYLKKNQHLEWNDKKGRFVYKFKYDIRCKDDILNYLRDGPLLISDDVEAAYEQIAEDVSELHEDHQILRVQNQVKKKDVIFLNPHQQSEDLPWEMPSDLRETWSSLPSVYEVDLEKYLSSKNVKYANLDTNVLPEDARKPAKSDEKKPRRKSRTKGGESD